MRLTLLAFLLALALSLTVPVRIATDAVATSDTDLRFKNEVPSQVSIRTGYNPTLPDALDDETIRLIVHPAIETGKNLDNRRTIEYFALAVQQEDTLRRVSDRTFFDGGIPKRTEIVINANEREQRIVSLPPKLSSRLARILTLGPPYHPFDCGAFLHYLFDKQYRPAMVDSNDWSFRELIPGESLPAGAPVFISRSREFADRSVVHFALSLGKGLYLSKFGKIGSVMVTELSPMVHAFEGRYVFRMFPRQSP